MPVPQQAMPKCFGTDFLAKWNMQGMREDAMKIDRPDLQQKCYECEAMERCYMANDIRISRIKR